MTRRRTRVSPAALAVIALLAGAAGPVWAHPGTPLPVEVETAAVTAAATALDPPPVALPPAAAVFHWLVMGLALLFGATLAAPRRTLVVILVLVLGLVTVESSVHSVHHLGDQQGAATCVIATATAQVPGAAEGDPTYDVQALAPLGAVLASTLDRPGSRPLRPDEGRAPPAA
jgi:hypothetical protein